MDICCLFSQYPLFPKGNHSTLPPSPQQFARTDTIAVKEGFFFSTQPFKNDTTILISLYTDWIWPVGGSLLLDGLLIPDLRDEHVTHKGSKSYYEIEFMDTGR